MGLGWVCERELREGLGGRPLHLPDGVVISTDEQRGGGGARRSRWS